MELNKRDISALIEAYTAMGSILCGSLEHIDPDRVMGIKGQILKLSIHANHFKHVAQTLYQKLDAPIPDTPKPPEAPKEQKIDPADCEHVWNLGIGPGDLICVKCGVKELAKEKHDPATCDHIWEMERGSCQKCGIEKLEWEAEHSGREEEQDDSSARNGPEENG